MKNWKITNFYEFCKPIFKLVNIRDFSELLNLVKIRIVDLLCLVEH